MANRYWVSASNANWDATAGSKWSTTSGGASGAAVPTAADDVFFDLTGNTNCTIPAATTVVCRSINFVDGTGGAYTGTFTWTNATTSILTIGDATAGASNVALKFSAGMTVTLTAGDGAINFISTSATQQTITTNGKTMPSFTQSGVGSSYVLGGALTTPILSGSTCSVTNGIFDTANYSMTMNILNSGGGATRTLSLGSSAISLARNGSAMQFTSIGLTMTANTAVITCTASATISMGGVNMNGTSLVFNAAGTKTITSGGTWQDVTVTGTATKTELLIISTADLTCTGTFTINGNSSVNRVLVQTNAAGSTRTITAATVSCSNVDFMDIAGAGAGDWDLSAITGLSGDCGGNSGIIFTTSATQTYDTTAGNWSTAARWTSRVPLPQDDVAFSTTAVAVAMDMPRVGKNVDFTNYTGTLTWTTSLGQTFYGSITLNSGMTLSFGNTVNYVLAGRGTHAFNPAGKLFNGTNLSATVTAPGGTYTLAGAYSTSGSTNVIAGTFTTNSYSLTTASFNMTGAIARTLNLGSSVVSLTQTSNTVWTISGSNFTINPGTSNIVYSTKGTAIRTFAGGGATYYDLTNTFAESIAPMPITGTNTFNSINLAPGKVFSFTQGVQNNIKSITGVGSAYGYQRFGMASAGNYVSIPDSAALSYAGDFDMRIKLNADAWATSNMAIGGKRTTASTGFTWQLAMNSGTKKLSLYLSSTGTTSTNANSTAAVPFSDFTDGWIRITWRASDGRTQFFTSTDSTNDPSAVSWTQLGTDRTIAVGSLFNSPAAITLATLDTAATPSFVGRMYRFQIRDNILDNGTGIQADVDFTTKTFGANTFTESSSNAATVSIVGDATQAGDGRIVVRSASAGSVANLMFYDTPQTLDGYDFKDIASTVPRKIFAPNSFNISNNLNIVFGAFVSEPYIAWQANVSGSGSTTTLPLPFTPVAGDLMVVGYGNTNNGTGTITPPAGWTLDKGTSAATSMRIYSKISDGTETSLVWTSSLAPAITTLQFINIRGFSGTPTLDDTDSNTTAGATSLSTGSGATNTDTPAVAIAMLGGNGGLGNSVSATNSYEWVRPATEVSTARTIYKPLSAIASTSSTYAWTTSRAAAFEMAVYKFVAASADDQLSMMLMGMGS